MMASSDQSNKRSMIVKCDAKAVLPIVYLPIV